MPKNTLSEREIKKQIIDYLEHLGALVVPQIGFGARGRMRTKKGVHDLIICYRGIFISIETKTKEGTMSEDQEEFAIKVNKAGGHWALCRSLQDAQELISNLDV